MKIVYATDGSVGAVVAGDLLAHLALTAEDSIVVLAVPPGQAEPDRLFAGVREGLEGTAATVQFELRAGQPAEQILEYAEGCGADLVVLGAIADPGVGHSFNWGNADRLLRQARTSVLIARPIAHGLKRALVAVDASEAAARVAAGAARLPLPANTELRLVTVLPPDEAAASIAPMIWSSLTGELEAAARGEMRAAEERLRSLARPLLEAGRPVAAEVARGDPSTVLIHAAASEQADLVFLGYHGEGGVDRLVLGSVAERTARHAPCSVLVVR